MIKFYFKEKLFSGFAYRFARNNEIDLLMIADGIELGLSDDFLSPDAGNIHIDVSDIDQPYEFASIFRCEMVGYIFNDDGTLYEESTYSEGCPGDDSRNWTSEGMLEELNTGNDSKSFYSNGDLKEHEIETHDGPANNFKVSINESKQLTLISLGVKDSLNNALMNEFGLADKIELRGKGIRNQELFTFINQMDRSIFTELSLFRTSITGGFLLSLDLSHIKLIIVSKDELITDNDLCLFQEKYPEGKAIREKY